MVILAAVDGESAPDRVVEVGYDLASDHDERLVVLHVMPQERFDARQEASSADGASLNPTLARDVSYGSRDASGSRDMYNLEDGERAAERVARDIVEDTLPEYDNVAFAGRVGEPVEEIIGVADRHDARYLVIGGRKRTPVGKAVFGSTTQSILLTADRPVMTVLAAE